jgi:small-conductance mechanosensitive channel
MNRQNWGIGIAWGIAIILVIVASIVGLRSTVENVTKIIVAVIGALTLVISAVVTHALTQARELQFEQQKQRQANYEKLLGRVASFVRKKADSDDGFDSGHIYSWVVGSKEVIKATQDFVKDSSQTNLKTLLLAMRADMGLGSVDDLMPTVFEIKTVPGVHKR